MRDNIPLKTLKKDETRAENQFHNDRHGTTREEKTENLVWKAEKNRKYFRSDEMWLWKEGKFTQIGSLNDLFWPFARSKV